MEIASAHVALQSQRAYSVRRQTQESLRAWVGTQNAAGTAAAPAAAGPATAAKSAPASASASGPAAVYSDPRMLLLKRLIEMLTGRPATVFDASQLQTASSSQPLDIPASGQAVAASRPAGYGIAYDYHASSQETEQTDVAAQGTVKTADGQSISFQLNLTMSRQYSEQVDVSFRAGDAQRKDPLVINFGGTAAQLLDTRVRFDLNADGKAVDVPLLAGGSAYLALDRNGNGKIDSGAELFGPAGGSGFKDLAKYDQDGNGWIDQNDPVLAQLKAWTPDQSGGGKLTSLKDLGVAALYLGSVASPFELRGQGNSALGGVRGTGLYLTEGGQAGSLQEIDLTI
jgi:hypothetical protein